MQSQGNYIRPMTRRWIGAIIKTLLIRNRVSGAEVAVKCKLNTPRFYGVMNGDTTISDFFYLYYLEEIIRSMEMLGIDPDKASWQVSGAKQMYGLIGSPKKAKEAIDELQTWPVS